MPAEAKPVDTKKLSTLSFPTPGIDVPDGDAVPLDTLLQALQLAASDEDRRAATDADNKWDAPTPPSMQVIKSGALTLTSTVTKRLAAFGGVGGALTALAGVISPFVADVGEPVTVALIGAAAVILSAVAISLALVVNGDLEARGVATASRHAGRARVAASFLEATAAMPTKLGDARPSLVSDLLAAMAIYPNGTKVTTARHQQPTLVEGMDRRGADQALGLKLKGDWVGLDEVTGFTAGV